MAKDLGTKTVNVTTTERTWRTEMFSVFGEDPRVVGHRERVSTLDDGTIVAREVLPSVERRLTEVAEQRLGGVTGLQLAGIISLWIDTWVTEEAARAQAAVDAALATLREPEKP